MNKENEFQKISRKNAKFFNDNLNYRQNINNIDTYHNIRAEVSTILSGTKNLLDIGHGGVFDYDTNKIQKIVFIIFYRNLYILHSNVFIEL